MLNTENDNDEWTKEVINILENVRINSINLSEYHRMRYYYYKGFSKYFDIPVLVLSTLSGTFSVGSQAYLEQSLISAIGCGISMLITIITSIKLYLNIQDTLQIELNMSKDFYTLAIDIYKILSLPHHLKGEKGLSYLNNKFSLYNKLVEASDLLQKKNKHDQLTLMNTELMNDYSANTTSNSDDNIQTKNKKYELPIYVNTPNTNKIIDPITTYNATTSTFINNKSDLIKPNINNKSELIKQNINKIVHIDPTNNDIIDINKIIIDPTNINIEHTNQNPLQQINYSIDPLEKINKILDNKEQFNSALNTISDEHLISLFENDSNNSKKKNKKKK